MLLIEPKQSSASRYTAYLREILRGEGFAGIESIGAPDFALKELHDRRLVILPRGAISSRVRGMLVDYVAAGGNLLAIQPDPLLVCALGVEAQHSALPGGYLHLAQTHPSAIGLFADAIQLPVRVECVSVNEDRVVAWASPARERGLSIPAVAIVEHGSGSAALLTFDVAHAIAKLRQGDPELADICSSGLDGVFRPSELFAGWLDPRGIAAPQADLLSALLARLIEERAPGPRLWYYPRAAQRSVVIMTSDDDWSQPQEFDQLIEAIEQRNGTATFFLVPHTRLDAGRIDEWRARGHAFSVHPALDSDLVSYRDNAEPQALFVDSMLVENVERHQADFEQPVATIRQHCARWLGYVEAARILGRLGVGMELNYLGVPPFGAGYMAGSGRPLRFVDEAGEIIDVFQQPTIWTEEALIHPEYVFSLKWTIEQAVAFSIRLLDESVASHYSPFAINSHPVSFSTYSRPLVEALLDHAVSIDVPIVSADAWHTFTRARDEVRFINHSVGQPGITLDIVALDSLPDLSLIFPIAERGWPATVTVDGSPVALDDPNPRVRRWGRDYLAINLPESGASSIRIEIRHPVEP